MSRAVVDCGIVGAGVAGLVAARTLAERGLSVRVLDKGRAPGGRASHRVRERFAFDHGASYFTARTPAFRRRVAGWLETGSVARWDGRIVSLDRGACAPREGTGRYVGVPGMNAVARALALGLDVRCSTRVASASFDGDRWLLVDDDGREHGPFASLLVTAPPPQSAQLVGPDTDLGRRLASVRMQACWAVLLGLDAPLAVPFDGAFVVDSPLAWIARESSKPGRGRAEAWVLHATPEWSARHAESDPDAVVERLLAAARAACAQRWPEASFSQAHLWRYARAEAPLTAGPATDAARRLAAAGDGCSESRIEGAHASGSMAADWLERALGDRATARPAGGRP